MQQPTNSQDQGNGHNNFHQFLINPFERRYRHEDQQFSVEKFIKTWIQSIFYQNKKIDLQTKIDIYWKTTEEKSFENTSCSIIYSIIRDTVETITWKLRHFIDKSFATLRTNSKSLCKLSQTSSSWEINWIQFKDPSDPLSFKNIYPPISNMYNTFYKYLNDAANQVYTLWKTIYEYISIKDLKCQTFQQSINELILEIFTSPTPTFKPRNMLPVISLANKCKFVNVDKEGSMRRMDLTKFREDELAINLAKASAKKMKEKGYNPEEAINFRGGAVSNEKINPFKHRQTRDPSKLASKNKLDTNLIEELRSQYLNSYKLSENMKEKIKRYRTVFQKLKFDNLEEDERQNLAMFGNFHFQTEDYSNSSQDDLNHLECDQKDELIEENEEVQIEQVPFYQRFKEIEAQAKLSSSTGIEENNDQNDIILKNQEFDNHPEFIMDDDFTVIDPYDLDQKEEQLALELSQKYIAKVEGKSTRDFFLSEQYEDIQSNLHKPTVQKSKKRISKQHDKPRQHSKCCLQQQKQKLQKYRKQLQKQKQELLRQVERFMKQKQKDNNLYRMVKGCRRQSKNCYKYSQEIKQIDFTRFKTTIKHNEADIISIAKEELETHGHSCFEKYRRQEEEELFDDEQSTGEVTCNSQESYLDEFKNNQQMSKRQQKLRKKIEREMKEFKLKQADCVNKAQQKQIISEEEAQLNQFLQNLNVLKANRTTWHIEEDRLEGWKDKLQTIRSKVIKEAALSQPSPTKQSKKKKTNKRKN